MRPSAKSRREICLSCTDTIDCSHRLGVRVNLRPSVHLHRPRHIRRRMSACKRAFGGYFYGAPARSHAISRAARPELRCRAMPINGVRLRRPGRCLWAGVAELVDALGLGSSDESCGGSSPSARTMPTKDVATSDSAIDARTLPRAATRNEDSYAGDRNPFGRLAA